MNILLIGDEATRIRFLGGMKAKTPMLASRPNKKLAALGVKRIYTLPEHNVCLFEVEINKTIAVNIGKLRELYDLTETHGIVCAFNRSAERKSKFLQLNNFPHIQINIFSSNTETASVTLHSLMANIKFQAARMPKAASLGLQSKMYLLNPFYEDPMDAKNEVKEAPEENVTFHAVTNNKL